MAKLGVNLDHVATLRQLRGTPYPDLLTAARLTEKAGAHQITLHLREDRRHIQDHDVLLLKSKLKVSLNLEMAVAEEIVEFAIKTKPKWTCLVPEKRQEVTTEGGLDLDRNFKKIAKVTSRLKKAGILVSLFVEPKIEAIVRSKEIDADAVELHTGRFCLLTQSENQSLRKKAGQELARIKNAALAAHELDLLANAGHGLDYENVKSIAALKDLNGLPLINEFNIGHSIICRSVFLGLEEAVKQMATAIRNAEKGRI